MWFGGLGVIWSRCVVVFLWVLPWFVPKSCVCVVDFVVTVLLVGFLMMDSILVLMLLRWARLVGSLSVLMMVVLFS